MKKHLLAPKEESPSRRRVTPNPFAPKHRKVAAKATPTATDDMLLLDPVSDAVLPGSLGGPATPPGAPIATITLELNEALLLAMLRAVQAAGRGE